MLGFAELAHPPSGNWMETTQLAHQSPVRHRDVEGPCYGHGHIQVCDLDALGSMPAAHLPCQGALTFPYTVGRLKIHTLSCGHLPSKSSNIPSATKAIAYMANIHTLYTHTHTQTYMSVHAPTHPTMYTHHRRTVFLASLNVI